MTVAPRQLVVVSYYWPPLPSIGAQRWVAMRRHLEAMGHTVTVVTSAAHGSLPDDGDRVVRTADLTRADGLRRMLRRPPLPQAGQAAAQTPAPALLTDVVVPDALLVGWAPTAVAAVRRLVRAGRADCVITSGPPDSAHLVGLALGPRRPPWIADFRDGWRFEPLRPPWPTGAQDRLDAWLERRTVRTAQVVAGATAPIADDLGTRLGADAHWISNGFDPVGVERADPPFSPAPGWATIAHSGTLSGPRGRDPRAFIAALREFNAGRADGQTRVRLLLAGRPSVADERLLAEADLGAAVEHVGLLDRSAVLALQRHADALLLLTGTDRSEATGKLFEYLAAGRPIVALAGRNEAARIVAETRTGRVLDLADRAGLLAALAALADGRLAADHTPVGLERFRYPAPAEAMAQLVDRAIQKSGLLSRR